MSETTFWAKVDVRGPDECWPWTGYLTYKGYGAATLRGQNKSASRVAWVLTAQITPPRHLLVCHTCHNPPCCNPAHLYLGTVKDNARDCLVAGRHPESKRTHCDKGHLFDAANTMVRKLPKSGNTGRTCRTCDRARPSRRIPRQTSGGLK